MNKQIALILVLIYIYGCAGNNKKKPTILEGPGIVCDSGMVVSAHKESSGIGVEILLKGGNAIDAAIATEFALAVCYPEAGNIGGGGFMVIRTSDGKSDVIDYREKAALKASRDMYLDVNKEVIGGLSTDTQLASGVPGTVDGMLNAHSRFGLLPFKEIIQPAIDLAEKGFTLSSGQAESLNSNRENFINRNVLPVAFVKETPWKEGDLLIQSDLAETLKRIRDNGRDGFYAGKTGMLIISEMSRGNGIITETDLKEYRSVLRKPLSGEYKGYKIITAPPPSGGGITLLQLLGISENYPLSEWGFHSSSAIHLMVEAERRAFADRSEFTGDPEYMKIPVQLLLDMEYLKSRMSSFNEAIASVSEEIKPGNPEAHPSEETTHYSVVDGRGNAVSATTTLNGTFGTGIVVGGAGFLLNNQMDDFSVKPGFPNMYGLVGGEVNAIQPGKRMLSSMTPVIVEKDGKLFMVAGSPGGSTIPTTVFQILVNVIDFRMSMQEAVDAGRFHHQWLPDWISYEKNSIDSLTLVKIKEFGHEIKLRSSLGRVNAIMISTEGKRAGGADKRGNNSAIGF